MSWGANRLFVLVAVLAPLLPAISHAQTSSGNNCPSRIAMWDFFVDSGLTASAQQAFKDQFCAQISKLETWGGQHGWAVPSDVPRLKILVGRHYNLARSLVPAWEGDRGRVEIPEKRAIANTADIAHEVFHVYFPNGNRMLAEGMAVYVQEEAGLNDAYPNEGKPLHTLMKCKAAPFLAQIRLSDLDETVTPDGITAEINQIEPKLRPAWAYIIAGSFTRYIIDQYGMDKFRDLYARTQFEPGHRVQRTKDDWADKQLYGRSLTNLEQDWKAMISGLNVTCPPKAFFDAWEQKVEYEFR